MSLKSCFTGCLNRLISANCLTLVSSLKDFDPGIPTVHRLVRFTMDAWEICQTINVTTLIVVFLRLPLSFFDRLPETLSLWLRVSWYGRHVNRILSFSSTIVIVSLFRHDKFRELTNILNTTSIGTESFLEVCIMPTPDCMMLMCKGRFYTFMRLRGTLALQQYHETSTSRLLFLHSSLC